MIEAEVNHISPKNYAETIDWLENRIRVILTEANCDMDMVTSKDQALLKQDVSKLIKEYESYINWCVEFNPYALKDIKDFRASKSFWEDFLKEQL